MLFLYKRTAPATTQATRHRPYALCDIPVPHPAYCASSARCAPHSLSRLSLSTTRATAAITTHCAHHPPTRFGVSLVSASDDRSAAVFPHVRLTTFLSLVPLDHPRCPSVQRPQRSNAQPTIHPGTRACCTATLRWLCAPHRAGPDRRVHATRLFACTWRRPTTQTPSNSPQLATPQPPPVLVASTAHLRPPAIAPSARHRPRSPFTCCHFASPRPHCATTPHLTAYFYLKTKPHPCLSAEGDSKTKRLPVQSRRSRHAFASRLPSISPYPPSSKI
ncbi:hypothetical protein B0H16DRAFT_427820 [Mycena metata]|uniref:Uncharacterized protein n=1 Tax=Mycena metata TaxID=1033252 RepID=A0AAD7JHS9_9AGAR|nr:hypothetical protein B0H16DRAFT_427820 [Mycena metata]